MPTQPRSSFYDRTAKLLLAAGTLAPSAHGAIIHMDGLSVTSTGDITPAGNQEVGLTIGTEFASSAYGFVRGIGPLSMASGDLFGFFRESSAPTVKIGDTPGAFSGSDRIFGYQSGSVFLANNAQFSSDNLFAFTFTSDDVNGGNPVYGWARISVSNTVLADARILEWAYDDSGATLEVGAVPEPSGLALLALGAAGISTFHRRRHRDAA